MKISRIIALSNVLLLATSFITAGSHSKKTKLPIPYERCKEAIESAYKDVNGVIDPTEVKMINDEGGSAVYGEIYPDSLKVILDYLMDEKNDHKKALTKRDTWCDLGSGLGKTCIQVALTTPANALGIELSKERSKRSKEAAKKIQKELGIKFRSKLEFQHEDILKADLTQGTVFFMCSTCFSTDFMQKIVKKIVKNGPGTRIISLKSLPEHKDVEHRHEWNLPMTWSTGTTVHLYEVVNSKKK